MSSLRHRKQQPKYSLYNENNEELSRQYLVIGKEQKGKYNDIMEDLEHQGEEFYEMLEEKIIETKNYP